MVSKVLVLAALVSAACAQVLPLNFYPSPVVPRIIPEPDYAPAQYQFQYDVNDPITGDVKNQEETRVNDALRGSYSFIQPDGLRRIVEYSDEGAGLTAIVRYEPAGVAPVPPVARIAPQPLVARIPQPLVARFAQPLVAPQPFLAATATPFGLRRFF